MKGPCSFEEKQKAVKISCCMCVHITNNRWYSSFTEKYTIVFFLLVYSKNFEMTYAKFLVKLCIFIPISLSTIIIWDLLKNKSLLSQYIHWISFGTAGIMSGIFTGKKMFLRLLRYFYVYNNCMYYEFCNFRQIN